MRLRTLLGIGLMAAMVVGCSTASMESKVVGKWRGKIEAGEAKKDDPAAKMAEAFASMMAFEFDLKADKTFTGTMMILPIEGNWTLAGNTVTLDITKVMGMDAKEASKEAAKENKGAGEPKTPEKMELELSADGTTMKIKADEKTKELGEMVFRKA